jgi:hypothetical protein
MAWHDFVVTVWDWLGGCKKYLDTEEFLDKISTSTSLSILINCNDSNCMGRSVAGSVQYFAVSTRGYSNEP